MFFASLELIMTGLSVRVEPNESTIRIVDNDGRSNNVLFLVNVCYKSLMIFCTKDSCSVDPPEVVLCIYM